MKNYCLIVAFLACACTSVYRVKTLEPEPLREAPKNIVTPDEPSWKDGDYYTNKERSFAEKYGPSNTKTLPYTSYSPYPKTKILTKKDVKTALSKLSVHDIVAQLNSKFFDGKLKLQDQANLATYINDATTEYESLCLDTLLKKLAEQYFLIKNQADGAFNTVSAFEELAGSTNNLLPTSVYNRIKIGVAHVVNHVNPNAAKVSIDKVSQDMDKANTLAKVQKMGDDFIEKIKALDIEKQSQAIEKLFGETNSEYLKYNISNLKGFFKKSFLILDKEERERIKKFLSDGFGLRRLDSDYYSMMKNLFEKDIIPFMESVDLNARVLKNKKRLASFCDDITKILEAPGQQNKIQCIYGLFHVNNLDDTNNQVEELSRILKKDLNGLTNTDTRMIELVFKYYDLKITNEDYSKIKEWFEKITPLIHSVLENARKEAEAKKKADAENAQKSNYFEPAVEIANAYKVLGVEPGAAPDQVTNAYRILARKNHPDKQINQSEDVKNKAEATMKELNNAIALLRNNGRAL